MSFDDLIADPSSDEEAEDAVLVGEGDEDGEDDEVHDALGVLAVVHCADAGDESEESGEAGVWFSMHRRRDRAGRGIGGVGFGRGIRACGRGGAGAG